MNEPISWVWYLSEGLWKQENLWIAILQLLFSRVYWPGQAESRTRFDWWLWHKGRGLQRVRAPKWARETSLILPIANFKTGTFSPASVCQKILLWHCVWLCLDQGIHAAKASVIDKWQLKCTLPICFICDLHLIFIEILFYRHIIARATVSEFTSYLVTLVKNIC